jgi:hypothetical protein
VRWWVVQAKVGTNWTTNILPSDYTDCIVKAKKPAGPVEHVYVSAVDRLGNISVPATQ